MQNNKYTVILQHANNKQGVVAYTGYSFAFAIAGFFGLPLFLLLIFKKDYKAFFMFLAYVFISAVFLSTVTALQSSATKIIYIIQGLYIVAVFVIAKFYNNFYISNLLKKGYQVVFNSSNMHFATSNLSQLVFSPTEITQVKKSFYKTAFTRLAIAVGILLVVAFVLNK